MAYRATEYETIGTSPNMPMFGHNTRTPLDPIYQMPPNVKSVSINTWVWELQDRFESVHTFVRKNTGMSNLRQKKAHDKRLSYEIFSAHDSIHVLFPVIKK